MSASTQTSWGPRKGTTKAAARKTRSTTWSLSPTVFAKSTGGGVFRKGVWRGNRTKNPWDIYKTLTDAKAGMPSRRLMTAVVVVFNDEPAARMLPSA